MSEERLNEEVMAVEAALGSLQLKPSALRRSRVMYLAGQASVKGATAGSRTSLTGWFWPLATAASLLMAFTLGGMLIVNSRPQTIQRVIYVGGDHADDSTDRPDATLAAQAEWLGTPLRTDYLALRRLVLTRGLDAWHVAHETASPEREALTPLDAYDRSIDLDRSG